MGQSSSVVLFGACGFTVTGVVENAAEVVLSVELTDTVIGCTEFGIIRQRERSGLVTRTWVRCKPRSVLIGTPTA